MLRNYFKIAFRTLWKNRLFTAINVGGLSLGLASAAVLMLFVQRGLTFDSFHKDQDRLFFIQSENESGRYNQTMYPVLGEMVRTFPEVETGTHVQGFNDVWISRKGGDLQVETRYVDSSFFDVFSFKLKYGNPATAMHSKRSVVLTEEIAKSLFGDRNPVGEHITADDSLHLTVTGVLETLPANSSIQFEVLLPVAILETNQTFMSNADWYNTFAKVYLKLRQGADPQKLQQKLPAFAAAHLDKAARTRGLHLEPFTEFIHHENPGFKWLITGATTIAVFILIIISINLINLNTAISFTRAREVAVRKVTGSSFRQVLTQFWLESGLVLIASLSAAVIFAVEYLVPKFNEYRQERMQLEISWSQDWPTLLTLLGVIVVIAFLAGTLPASYLNKLDIQNTMKGNIAGSPSSGRMRRGGLIVVQLVIAFGLVIGAIAVRKQVAFMREANLGFDKENVVVVESDLQYQDEMQAVSSFTGIYNDLRANSAVESVVTSGVVPGKYWFNYNEYLPMDGTDKAVRLRHVGTSEGYTKAYRIAMLEGRDFSGELDGDGDNRPVVINEAAMKAFGWRTAVGKQIRQKNNPKAYTVVGVMKDFNYQNLKESVEPLVHWYEGKASLNSYLTIRFHDLQRAQPVLDELGRRMKLIPSRKPFKYFYLSEELSRQYNHLDGIWKMLNFVTTLSIVIAFAGIFGLITLLANRRMKEVGIRKTLGADLPGLVLLLCREFVILIGIAVLLGCPLAYFLTAQYLDSFTYHIHISWSVYVAVALAALLLTLLTAGTRSLQAALRNPVDSLRNDS